MLPQRSLICDVSSRAPKYELFPSGLKARRRPAGRTYVVTARARPSRKTDMQKEFNAPFLSKVWTRLVFHSHLQTQQRKLAFSGVSSGVHVSFIAGSLGGAGGGSGHGGTGGKGGGGNWGHDGWSSAAGTERMLATEETSDGVEQVVLLDVRGMKCGGCVSHVKRILEEQPHVSQASINLATETALVRIKTSKAAAGAGDANPELKTAAEALAQVLTERGFPSSISEKPRSVHPQ